jgi:hypothetical protein
MLLDTSGRESVFQMSNRLFARRSSGKLGRVLNGDGNEVTTSSGRLLVGEEERR